MSKELGPNRRHVRVVIEMNINDTDDALDELRDSADKMVDWFEGAGFEPGEVMVQVEDGGLLE
jgi:hypothetical protein